MRAIDCPCGHRLEGADDDELFRLAKEHIASHHPEMERSDERDAVIVGAGVFGRTAVSRR